MNSKINKNGQLLNENQISHLIESAQFVNNWITTLLDAAPITLNQYLNRLRE